MLKVDKNPTPAPSSTEQPKRAIKINHLKKEDISKLENATFLPRFFALLLDGVIIAIIQLMAWAITSIVLKGLPKSDPETLLRASIVATSMLNIVISWIYFIEATAKRGQTLGKKIIRIKVVKQDNTAHIGRLRAFLREWIGKIMSAMIFGIGFLLPLFRKDRLALHDMVASTKVVKCD
ncbi:MAG: RDD family protein [Bacteriovoracaceae bacterium]|nr:RDD family protein [Bacteriovoracaceae bacterium]